MNDTSPRGLATIPRNVPNAVRPVLTDLQYLVGCMGNTRHARLVDEDLTVNPVMFAASTRGGLIKASAKSPEAHSGLAEFEGKQHGVTGLDHEPVQLQPQDFEGGCDGNKVRASRHRAWSVDTNHLGDHMEHWDDQRYGKGPAGIGSGENLPTRANPLHPGRMTYGSVTSYDAPTPPNAFPVEIQALVWRGERKEVQKTEY